MARAQKKTTDTFKGFSKKALTFFKGLDFYQSKQWFDENKPIYEKEVLQPLQHLLALLNEEVSELGLPLTSDPKTSIFRIHRDVRFSKDKTPYKTHAAAVLSRDGRKMVPGMVYIHIDPEGSFVALGTYHPDPESLAGMREAITQSSKRWLKICKDLSDAGFTFYREDALKRLPRGYETWADTDMEQWLKMRSFIVKRELSQKIIGGDKLVPEIVEFVEAGRKFLEFTWSAIDHARAKNN